MNELLVQSLIVSILVFNAFCMNPSSWKPPAPDDVVFSECFFVPEIDGKALSTNHNYRHICLQKFPHDKPQPAEHNRNWYFVGSLRSTATESQNLQPYDYVQIRQLLIKFIYLKDVEVKLLSRATKAKFKVIFQSAQQRQAFYAMICSDVILHSVAPNKISVLHEVPIREDGTIGLSRKIGNNIEALCETINDHWYISFMNEQRELNEPREPVLIFCQDKASITCMRRTLFNKTQLLMQAHKTYYILTFPEWVAAKLFSDSLLAFVPILPIKGLDPNLKNRLKFNDITLNS